jgi:hypothetical protein
MDPAFLQQRPWNEDWVLGAKRALKKQQLWAIRFWLDRHRRLRDRALFDFAITDKRRDHAWQVAVALLRQSWRRPGQAVCPKKLIEGVRGRRVKDCPYRSFYLRMNIA